MERMTPEKAFAKLKETTAPFARVFRRGSLTVELYRPEGVDCQQPHSQDELYVVLAGSGEFVLEDHRQPFRPGEVLFVPAGAEHRFENFTPGFVTWVIFHGPEGGEL